MPQLEYFIVAESCSVDQETNRLSLFNVIEELRPGANVKVSENGDQGGWVLLVPELIAVSGWNPSPGDEATAEHQLTTRVSLPDGSPREFVQPVVFDPNRRGRVLNRIAGIQITQPGLMRIEILLDGDHVATHTVTVLGPE